MLYKLSAMLISLTAVAADLEAANAICRAAVGPSSYCRTDNRTCQGKNSQGLTVKCGAIMDAPATTTTTTPVATTGRLRSTGTNSGHVASAAAPVKSGSSDGMFLWVEFPEQIRTNPKGWKKYYEQILQFTNGNKAGITVNRLILRVMNPTYGPAMWQATDDSIFVRDFLDRVRPDIDLRIYPYMDKDYCHKWIHDMHTTTCLEAAFAYTAELNRFLATHRPEIKFNGVVTDLEESERLSGDFHLHFNLLRDLKRRYGLSFGTSVGYTRTAKRSWAQESAELFADVDEMYMQMYDWEHIITYKPISSGSSQFLNKPEAFLRELTSKVIKSQWYTSGKLQFMWAVQSRDAGNCLYPLSPRKQGDESNCGAREQFGKWAPAKFLEFVALAKQTIPGLAGKAHGMNEFDLMPLSWI